MYGKKIVHGREIHACCVRPKYADVFVFLRPFRAVICKNCGRTTPVWGPFMEWVFKLFFWPFWQGEIYINTDQITDEDMVRMRQFLRQV